MASTHSGKHGTLRQLKVCGIVIVIGYVGLFCLLQSPAIWYSLRPDPIRSLFPDVFRPINAAFPLRWVYLDRAQNFALIMAPMYLAVVGLITAPLLYLLKRLSRPGALMRADKKPVLWAIFGFTLLIMFVLLFERGLLSSDIYSNVWYTRIWVQYGASPFAHLPNEFPPDPEGAIYWVGWQQQPLVYGPAWLVISAASYKIGQLLGGSFSALLLSSRLLTDAAHLLNAWLVWSITGLILARRRPGLAQTSRTLRIRLYRPLSLGGLRARSWILRTVRAARYKGNGGFRLQTAALLFYLWNPLLLVEFAGNGHNDVLMLTFVLLAVWLHLRGRWPLAALALGIATLVKLPAIILVPGYLWLLLWEGVRAAQGQRLAGGVWRGARALAIMFAAWVVFYAPFWDGPSTLLPLVSGPASRIYTHSLADALWWNTPELLANVLRVTHGREDFMDSVRQFLAANLRIGFLVLLGVIALLMTWRARTFSRALTAWGWLAIAAIMAQGWFWPWYVSWAVAPATLASSRRLRNTALVFSISSLLQYVEEQILSQHFKLFFDWSGVFIMAPPLVYFLFSWLLEAWRSRRAYSFSTNQTEQLRSETLGQPEPAR